MFLKNEPPARGIPHIADKVLVESISRAGRTREMCETQALKLVRAMGYPDAEIRYSDRAAAAVHEDADELGTATPGF